MKKGIIVFGIVGILLLLAYIVKKRRDALKKGCGCKKDLVPTTETEEFVGAPEEKDMEEFAQGTSLIAGSTLLLLMVLVGGLIALTVYAVGNVGKAVATDTEGTLNKVDRGLDTAQKAKTVLTK